MQPYRQGAGHVVIAGAGELQAIRGTRHKSRRGLLTDHHQRFQSLGDTLVRQAVVAMATLDMQTDQGQVLELRQMGTGSGGADLGNACQFRTGAGMAVHQRTEHPGTRRFGNGRSHLGHTDI